MIFNLLKTAASTGNLLAGLATGTATISLGGYNFFKYSREIEEEKQKKLAAMLKEKEQLLLELQKAKEEALILKTNLAEVVEKKINITPIIEKFKNESTTKATLIEKFDSKLTKIFYDTDWYQLTMVGSKVLIIGFSCYFCWSLVKKAPNVDDLATNFWETTGSFLVAFKDNVIARLNGDDKVSWIQGVDKDGNLLKLAKTSNSWTGLDQVALTYGIGAEPVNVSEGLQAVTFVALQKLSLKEQAEGLAAQTTLLESLKEEMFSALAKKDDVILDLNSQILFLTKRIDELGQVVPGVDEKAIAIAKALIFNS
jgi:hypothetical protein